MLVFGALVMTILPLTIVYNPSSYYPAILVAASLSVIGAGIIGSGQSMLISRLLNKNERQTFYDSNGLVMLAPFLVAVILLAAFTYSKGIVQAFKFISIGAIAILLPVYIVLVLWSSKKTM